MNSKDGAKDFVGVRKGLDGEHSLGELEAQILDVVWELTENGDQASTSQVFKVVYSRRELSYSTIMLTMSKLAKKGLLEQTREGETKTSPFMYRPTITREQVAFNLLNSVSQQVLRKSLKETVDSGLLEKLLEA